MLKVEGLHVAYGPIQTIYDVGFLVEEGECVALLGSNGAGKTTILNSISGMIKPTSGKIEFLDRLLGDASPGDRFESGLVQVPEGGKIFPYMTVKENLFMGAACRSEAWKTRTDSLRRVYDLFPLLKAREHYQSRLLSGGERQMLVLGRGLMSRPRLLMIDEPSLGLAPRILLEIYETLRRFLQEGVTILLSEQNVQQALKVAGRGYVLENGRVVMDGSSDFLLNSSHIKQVYLGI